MAEMKPVMCFSRRDPFHAQIFRSVGRFDPRLGRMHEQVPDQLIATGGEGGARRNQADLFGLQRAKPVTEEIESS